MDGFSPSSPYELGFGEVGGSKHTNWNLWQWIYMSFELGVLNVFHTNGEKHWIFNCRSITFGSKTSSKYFWNLKSISLLLKSNSVNPNKWDKLHKVGMNSLTSSWRCEKLWSYFFHPSGLSIIKHISLQGFWISKPSGGKKAIMRTALLMREGLSLTHGINSIIWSVFFKVSVHIKLSHFWGSHFLKQISAFQTQIIDLKKWTPNR